MTRRKVTLKYSYSIGEDAAIEKSLEAYKIEGLDLNPEVIDVYHEDKWIHVTIEHDKF